MIVGMLSNHKNTETETSEFVEKQEMSLILFF